MVCDNVRAYVRTGRYTPIHSRVQYIHNLHIGYLNELTFCVN